MNSSPRAPRAPVPRTKCLSCAPHAPPPPRPTRVCRGGLLVPIGGGGRRARRDISFAPRAMRCCSPPRQLGTGMFSTLQKQREFYENAAKLSEVVDSFYNGAYKADWQVRNPMVCVAFRAGCGAGAFGRARTSCRFGHGTVSALWCRGSRDAGGRVHSTVDGSRTLLPPSFSLPLLVGDPHRWRGGVGGGDDVAATTRRRRGRAIRSITSTSATTSRTRRDSGRSDGST